MSNICNLPLLFIPGLACTKALFNHQIKALERDYEIIIGDHTGHDSLGAIANSILDNAPARFALVGLSMGGYLSFEILRQAPERVERLALLDTSARGDIIEKADQRRIEINLARAGKFDQVCRAIPDSYVAKSRSDDFDLKKDITDMAMDMGVEKWMLQMQALMGRSSSVALLAYIKCPTLVVVGDEDQLTPMDCAVEMAENIPGARLEVIKDCGHMSTMERPNEVTALLQEWLK
jgi:pimeloyl-ACP methyl ester carboxylesterase